MTIDLTGLRVRTAHVDYHGHGRLDITRRSRSMVGVNFADPWTIAEPWEERKAIIRKDWDYSSDLAKSAPSETAKILRASALELAKERLARAFSEFSEGYVAHLERSKGIRTDAWTELGEWAREKRSIVGVCKCEGRQVERHERCHRFVWARHLAAMGAVYEGEVPQRQTRKTA